MSDLSLTASLAAFERAARLRAGWEPLWQTCYDYALPQRRDGGVNGAVVRASSDHLFDATAADAVQQLASSLLAELAPPWSHWFTFVPGTAMADTGDAPDARTLEAAARVVQAQLARSNLTVELHQAFLDLVTVGTGTLLFEDAPVGAASAFRFAAVPIEQLALGEGTTRRIEHHFRRQALTLDGIAQRYPEARLPAALLAEAKHDPGRGFTVIEALRRFAHGYRYQCFLAPDPLGLADPMDGLLLEGTFESPPFISFRWVKSAGETYGRSPVMTALPDIKTANKVVELVLKNASIAVTGIWQADDDGVLNPANIRLVPGAIIPKAVGSAGLTPLQAPGRFDVSELVLDDMRRRIRRTLLVEQLAPVAAERMTATEVLVRARDMARLLGATYGRLQSELLRPLIERAVHILARRGEIPPLKLDGRQASIKFLTPIARAQARDDVENTLLWLDAVKGLGAEAGTVVDAAATVRWLADALGVPPELLRHEAPMPMTDTGDLP